jgi:DNA repair protein RadC
MAKAYIRKLTSSKVEEIPAQYVVKVTSSKNTFDVAWALWDKDALDIVEHFGAVYLDRKNRVVGWAKIAEGGTCAVVVDLKIVFTHALLCNASGLVLVHNHPSGDTNPGDADRALTRKAVQAGKVLDMEVFDHIIMAPDGSYFSFADNGLM